MEDVYGNCICVYMKNAIYQQLLSFFFRVAVQTSNNSFGQ